MSTEHNELTNAITIDVPPREPPWRDEPHSEADLAARSPASAWVETSPTDGRSGERHDTRSIPAIARRLRAGSVSRFGSYLAVRTLGAGGMGEVFAARHLDTGEEVALKTLSSTNATRLYRFKREFRALADVAHENLVRLHELVVPSSGPAFFTMELVDGQPFVEWVRETASNDGRPELARLEPALRQLVRGVHHLHSNGCIHRDLKPSNVLVTAEGRVVVLDFGLVSEPSEPERGISYERQILGTPGYMSPEQALGLPTGPAADWYAVGVMLFECFAGRLPPQDALLASTLAEHPSATVLGDALADVPEPLRTLCMRLLSRDPDARPGGEELHEHFFAPSPTATPTPTFVGRHDELAALHAALLDVGRNGEPVVLHLRGRSGHGKSTLVRRFREELRTSQTVVLHGRCRERETVPYKGIDAIVDALAAHLHRQPERARLRPRNVVALVHVFPVLGELWPAAGRQSPGLDATRKLATSALRQLLTSVSEQHPLVVHIDDFQWADRDSVALLQELVRPPSAPALLLLLSYRAEPERFEVLRALLESELLAGPTARSVELGPLSSDDAHALATALLRTSHPAEPPPASRAETIALRSGGSPFFIAQMALASREPDSVDTDLDHITARRLAELDAPARRLLEAVAVFGRPLSVGSAIELGGPASAQSIAVLCEWGLLVREASPAGALEHRVETAHDRVREVVLAELDPDERARLHRRIGELLLARHGGDPTGDDLFEIANHCNSGTKTGEPLSDEHRLTLARLDLRAGGRARESSAWVAARRYLGCAYELVEPWLPDARAGRGHYELCVAIAFGRAQVEAVLDDAGGDAAFGELLGWALTKTDHGRIAEWYMWNLSIRARWPDCLDFGLQALARLGLRIPRRPSLVRALASYFWGWRSLRKIGFDRIHHLPRIHDDAVRSTMEILACATGFSWSIDIRLHLALAGAYGRMLPRHGFHDGAITVLATVVLSAAARGNGREARALQASIQSLVDHSETSGFAQYIATWTLLCALPIFQPVRDVVALGQEAHRRACEDAPGPMVDLVGFACTYGYFLGSVPLPQFTRLLDTMDAQHHARLPFVENAIASCRNYITALSLGDTTALLAEDLHPQPNPMFAAARVAAHLPVHFMLGDHDRAWAGTCELDRGYERRLGAISHTPVYAMISALVIGDRWPGSSWRVRLHLRRMLRRRRSTGRRWAQWCTENYQPMLDIIEGEIAVVERRHEDSLAALERAYQVASAGEMLWVAGLASERLAKLARRCGRALQAEAAFDAARSAYEAWGATAVVRRLDRERATTSSRRAGPTIPPTLAAAPEPDPRSPAPPS